MTIAVTGGNGELGRAVVTALTARTDEPVVATVRDPSLASLPDGVAVRPGDFDDPATLERSLVGVSTLLVNATFFGADTSRRAPRVAAAIDAAARAGVDRVVLTTWADLDRATVPLVQDYVGLEARLRAAGPDWTILRASTGLADALARDVVWARRAGELVAPADGARATPAALTDLAEAAAVVLTSDGHDGAVHELTGPDVVTWDDLAELAGTPLRTVPEDAYREVAAGAGFPPAAARQLLDLYRDLRGPWSSEPTSTLGELLGRAPVPGVEAVRRRVAAFPVAS
ncbi:NAD(P)H-binding protein [Luteimicrobium sp. NPDC057192]|uniref:NAD(P)H-binding protein n=1 Tax=Luteimicrobium sp. NPDC057192 TaxID=3346042 RepID=UPI003626D86F